MTAIPAERFESTEPGRPQSLPAVEWPTVFLLLVAYGGWLAITDAYRSLPLWVVAPVAAVLVTLHSSLQHEILHGHPTRWRGVNRLCGIIPLSLWLPYARYRETHLMHHINDRLTDPADDPETNYFAPAEWAATGPVGRAAARIQATLAGRVVVGSFWRIGRFLRHEFRAVVGDQPRLRRLWAEHLLWCVPVVLWITLVCGMPLWVYVVAIVIPANGILLIRSFAEHRALPDVPARTAIVEGSRLLGPLFLFNNLHVLHHDEPMIPWYQYNERYRAIRERLIAENGGLLYSTYFDVARRYLFRPHDVLVHPTGGVPRLRAA